MERVLAKMPIMATEEGARSERCLSSAIEEKLSGSASPVDGVSEGLCAVHTTTTMPITAATATGKRMLIAENPASCGTSATAWVPICAPVEEVVAELIADTQRGSRFSGSCSACEIVYEVTRSDEF